MTRITSEATESADTASQRAQYYKGLNYNVVVTGPVDVVRLKDPGGADLSWPNGSGKSWYIVVASERPLTPV